MTNYTSLERSHWDLSIAKKMKVFWPSWPKLWLIWWFFSNSRRAAADSWDTRKITLQRVSSDWPSAKRRVKLPFYSHLSIIVAAVMKCFVPAFCCVTEIVYYRIIGFACAWNCYYMISDYNHLTMSVELAALLHNISYFICITIFVVWKLHIYLKPYAGYIIDSWHSRIYDLEKQLD